ncbi:lipoprotein-releasing ABC transporter permease subunit [Marinicella sp. S1101]|uniref:lipoprotein-releasing ABC transporter permease subunit n=1 Tax=Marinicella marina TaxID=2996016 RepID=UPI002260F8BD|nr:lipoprotein-releasing ABC transporter permease subunit [Marinicella marina]MCX7553673.1 lipoprotein-releasing ABC transporter permease subunit [Marinicella marina]MDJ1140763.1 lipoprotein-releasing ABC transporter permease subunit [Marinicella marina]
MNLPLFIGLRYTKAKRKNHFISFISLISMAGIALGVMTVIVVISVMNGFNKEFQERILSTVSHATISAFKGDHLNDWQNALEIVERSPRVEGAAPYIQTEGMLQGFRTEGALIQGVLPEFERTVTEFQNSMSYGSFDDLKDGEFNIILGTDLAAHLGVGPGETVNLYVPEFRTTAVGVTPRLKRFTVVGIFEVGMYEYDFKLALIHMEDARKLLRIPKGAAEGVRIKVDDLMQAPQIVRELAPDLDGFYRIRDWTQEHVNFFKATRTERMVMFIILSMIVAVAAFNILSTLVMLVTEKQADVAILRTLGISSGQIMGIFMVSGTLIGLIGTTLGTIFGIITAININSIIQTLEGWFNTEFLSKDVYYITEISADLQTMDVLTIIGIAFGLSILATIYPAWRASRVEPAEALRYE